MWGTAAGCVPGRAAARGWELGFGDELCSGEPPCGTRPRRGRTAQHLPLGQEGFPAELRAMPNSCLLPPSSSSPLSPPLLFLRFDLLRKAPSSHGAERSLIKIDEEPPLIRRADPKTFPHCEASSEAVLLSSPQHVELLPGPVLRRGNGDVGSQGGRRNAGGGRKATGR